LSRQYAGDDSALFDSAEADAGYQRPTFKAAVKKALPFVTQR